MPTMLWMVSRYTGTRETAWSQQFDELLHRRVDGNGDHLRPRLHGFAHRLAAEFDHRLDQVAIALLNDAFFLPGFDKRIDRLGRSFRLFSSDARLVNEATDCRNPG